MEVALWNREISERDINNSSVIEILPNLIAKNIIVTARSETEYELPDDFEILGNLTHIDSSEIYNLVEDLDKFISENGTMPEYFPQKMSEYSYSLRLIRSSDNEFIVLNWYFKPIEGIPEIGHWFKKND